MNFRGSACGYTVRCGALAPGAHAASEPRLNAVGQRAEIGYALHFVVGQLDAEVMFQAREQIERLQAVDLELFVKIVVRRKLLRAAL